jgi:hypothetical protein
MRILIDRGIVRRGRPYNLVIRDRILEILKELPIATPQRIKEKYESDYKVPISWNTVVNRLNDLVKDNKVFIIVTTPKANIKATKRRRIHKIYSLRPLKANSDV